MRRAEAAAVSGSKLTPPSEKESGVTLMTPMTEGRKNRSSIGTTKRCLHEADTPPAAGLSPAAHEQRSKRRALNRREKRARAGSAPARSPSRKVRSTLREAEGVS